MEELIPFSGGLNKDDDLLEQGFYRDANNIILTSDIDQEEGGSIRGIKTMDSLGSNEDIATLIGASGDITYLDAATDNEDEDIVYILCENSSTAHILKYVISTDTATKVVSYSTTATTYQHFFRVLGDVLIWNYNNNYAVYCISKTASNVSTSNEYELSLVAQSPLVAPDISITGTDFSLLFSERAWQFAHRFVYADGRISALSPFSDIIGYQEEDEVNTNISEVQVSITESWDTGVAPTRLEVYVRESDIGTWRRCKTFESITSGVANTFNWSGQRFETLPGDYASSLFNFAPKYAKSADVIDNRIFLGNGKYFNDDESGTLSISIVSGAEFASGDYTSSFASGIGTSTYRPFTNNSTYRIGVIGLDNNGRTRGVEDEAEFNTGDFDYPVTPSITVSASGTLPSWMTKYQVVVSESQTKDYFYEGLASAVYYLSTTDDSEYYSTAQDENTEFMVVDLKDFFADNLAYTFNQGDQIRGKFGGSSVDQVEILGQRGSKILCRVPSDSSYTYDPTTNYEQLWVEIISPKETAEFTFYGTDTIGDTSGLPDSVNIQGDSFLQYKDIPLTTNNYLVKKSAKVSVSSFSASGDDVVEFDTTEFNPEIEGISPYLNAGDNSGFYITEDSTVRFNAVFTVDSYTGSGAVYVIPRDPSDNSIASGELTGSNKIELNSFLSNAGAELDMSSSVGSNVGDNNVIKIDTSNAVWFYAVSGNLYGQLLSLTATTVTENGSRQFVEGGGVGTMVFQNREVEAVLIDSTTVLVCFSRNTTNTAECHLFTVDTGAGTFTLEDSLEFHSDRTGQISADKIDASNVLIWYGDIDSGDTKGQLISISGSVLSLNGSAYSIPDSVDGNSISSYLASSTQAIMSYRDTSGNNEVVSVDIDTVTPSLSAGTPLSHWSGGTSDRVVKIDGTNGAVVWNFGSGDLHARLITTNASGDVTTNGSVTTVSSISDIDVIEADIDGTSLVGVCNYGVSDHSTVFGFSFDTGAPSLTYQEQIIQDSGTDGGEQIVKIDSGLFLMTRKGDGFDYAFARLINVGSGAGDYTLQGEVAITAAKNLCLALSTTTITVSDVSLEVGYLSDYSFSDDGSNQKHVIAEPTLSDTKLAIRSPNLSKSTFWRKGLGKPFIELDTNFNEYLTNRVYWGQKYIKETKTNPFNYFYFDDAVQIPFEVGAINALVNTSARSSSPGTLLVICEEKPVSIYIGANLITNTDGTTSLVTSDRVVNGTNVLASNNGITLADKNSIVSYDGQVFWRDSRLNGAVCRYTREGVVRISDLKMKSYFNSKKSNVVSACYDPYYKMYLISVDGTTVGFDGRWRGFYPDRVFLGKAVTTVGDKIYTFEDASGTLLAEASLGSDQSCDITLAKHTMRPIEPKYIGIVMTGMSTNDPLSGATDTNFSVVIQNEKGQLSTLTNYDFIIEDQDYLYADVMADESSSGGKLNGEQLVGSKHTIKLNIPSGDRVRLVVIGSEPSLGHF